MACKKAILFLLSLRIWVLDIYKNRLSEAIQTHVQSMFLEVINTMFMGNF